jgi:Cu(I)/Ag(I) efflux system membrane protein CusA/SilA
MVDGAIVMIENYHKHLERQTVSAENRWRIAAEAASEVGPALFFSLLIITLSFLPVFALEAQEGRLFKPLAYTKTYAMAAASILAVTLTPVVMGYLIRGRILPERRNPLNRLLIAAYRPFISLILKAPLIMVAVAIVAAASMAYPLSKLGSEFMPELDEGDLLYMPSAYPAVSIGKMQQVLQQTNKLIATLPEVDVVYGKAGRADTATDPAPLTMVETTIKLKPRDQWRDGMTMERLKQELDALVQVPSLTNVWIMPIKNRIDMLATGIKTPVGIKVAGPDLDTISSIGARIEEVLAPLDGTLSVYAERVTGGRFIDVDIDRIAAARYGMNVADVQDIVRTAIGGMTVTTSVEGLERYPVNVRYPQAVRDSVDQLKRLPVVTPSGAHVPLSELARVSVSDGPGMIRSENARRNGWIYVDIAGRDLGSYVAEAQATLAERLDLPPGYSIGWSGQYEYMERARERLGLVVPVTLAIIVVLLYMHFRNAIAVGIILGTLPLSLIGGVWLLYGLGYNLSVAVGVGFIALAGVAVEIGILMLAYLEQALKRHREAAALQGRALALEDLREAVVEGALLRVRPIVMTVAVIILGLLPIVMGRGTGSEVMSRIAAPMIGGMSSALVLTLLVLPAVFLIWKRLELRPHRKRGEAAEAPAPSSSPAQ